MVGIFGACPALNLMIGRITIEKEYWAIMFRNAATLARTFYLSSALFRVMLWCVAIEHQKTFNEECTQQIIN